MKESNDEMLDTLKRIKETLKRIERVMPANLPVPTIKCMLDGEAVYTTPGNRGPLSS